MGKKLSLPGGKDGRAPSAHLFLGTLRVEIFQNRFKIKQNLCVRLKAYLYFGSLFEREIIQKLSSKLIKNYWGAPVVLLYWESPDGEKSFKIGSKSNRIFAYA